MVEYYCLRQVMDLKLRVEEQEDRDEVEIIIKCPRVDNSITKIINMINTFYIQIHGKKDGITTILTTDDIYYFEAVENRVFAYTKKQVYEVNSKLQELADLLNTTMFIQTARTLLLNIAKIKKISTLVNGRILAVLDNGEKTIITRAYAGNFKKKLRG